MRFLMRIAGAPDHNSGVSRECLSLSLQRWVAMTSPGPFQMQWCLGHSCKNCLARTTPSQACDTRAGCLKGSKVGDGMPAAIVSLERWNLGAANLKIH